METIRAFAAANHADHEWSRKFETEKHLQLFSLELQRDLVSDSRRVAIDATLDDIAIGGDGSFLVFAHAAIGWIGPTLHLRLKTEEGIAKSLLAAERPASVLLVTSLTKIWRPLLSVETVDDISQIGVDSWELVATGTLIAAKPLPY